MIPEPSLTSDSTLVQCIERVAPILITITRKGCFICTGRASLEMKLVVAGALRGAHKLLVVARMSISLYPAMQACQPQLYLTAMVSTVMR